MVNSEVSGRFAKRILSTTRLQTVFVSQNLRKGKRVFFRDLGVLLGVFIHFNILYFY